jgi:hypothetical protein
MVLLLWVGGTFPALSESITQDQIQYWGDLIGRKDLAPLFAELGVGPKQPWPPIVSEKYAGQLTKNEAIGQEHFRQLALRLAEHIERYESRLESVSTDMNEKQFLDTARAMLLLRDQISERPSYVNFVLVDTINRVVFVNAARRIVRRKETSAKMRKLVEHLQSFKADMKSFLSVCETELGKQLLQPEEIDVYEEDGLYRKLWAALEPETFVPSINAGFFPKDIAKQGTYDMLQSQYLVVLMARLAVTDFYINFALPLTLLYKDKAATFSPEDDYQSIKQILGKEVKGPASLGAKVFNRKPAGAVAELLRQVRSKRIDQQLLFHLRSPSSP